MDTRHLLRGADGAGGIHVDRCTGGIEARRALRDAREAHRVGLPRAFLPAEPRVELADVDAVEDDRESSRGKDKGPSLDDSFKVRKERCSTALRLVDARCFGTEAGKSA